MENTAHTKPMTVRFAEFGELERVNELRRQVNELHVKGAPEIFRDGFPDELRDLVYSIFEDPDKRIVVCDIGGTVCGFAVLNHIVKPGNPFMHPRDFLDIDEFCVDEAYRRQGAATEMIRFIRDWAKAQGFTRLELNMWEFNAGALEFYESVGFRTYRRYMDMEL